MRKVQWLVPFFCIFFFAVVAAAQTVAVDDVVIEGNQRVDPAAIRAELKLKAGPAVSLDEIDRGVQAVYRMARFADVRVAIEERGGRQTLICTVKERPLVRSVKFEGNDELSEEKLRPLLTLKLPSLYDPVQLERSIAAIRKMYEEEGFYAVAIEKKVQVNELNEAHVVLKISEGEEILIDSLRFDGVRAFDVDELTDKMETKKRWFLSWLTGRGTYQEEILKNDLELITDRYMDRGYIQVKVHQPEITLIKEKRFLDILIEVEEGEQYRVGALDVKGDLLFEREKLLAQVPMTQGDIFSRKSLREGMMAINDLYTDQGYAYVNVAPLSKLNPAARTVDLTVEIEQGPQVKARRIEVSGNEKTFDKVIRREIQLAEGEVFSSSKIKESRRLVQNLGFFEEVKVATKKGDVPEEMDVVVEVKEKPTGTFSLGFGYSSIDGFIGQTSVTQDNLFGRGLKGNLSASVGSKSTTYQFGLLDPHFLDSNISLGFDLYKTDREWSDFSKRAIGGDLKFGFPLARKTRAFFIYRYEEKEIYDVDDDASSTIRDQEGFSTLSSIYGSITRDTTDYRLDPTTGHLTSASIEFAGLGGTDKFLKYEFSHRYFYPLFWKFVFSAHGKIGYVQEIDNTPVPIDERYYLGGLNSLRGFEPRTVGPKVLTSDGDYEYTGGDKAAWGNLEITFPLIPDSGFKGVVFYDMGNAWEEGEAYFSDLRRSAGFGLRWLSPLGPLRLEWGRNLSPRDDEPNTDLQFSIGTMF